MEAKYKSNGNPGKVVWNPETNKNLCQFVNGEFVTDDKNAIRILDSLCAGDNPVISRADGKATEAVEFDMAEIPPAEMSVKQLIAYAKENEIDLPKGKQTKVQILAIVEQALEATE